MNEGSVTAVAIVGAGPYGVSIGAHLRSAGVDFRIFGQPMSRWRWHMPEGMLLKSEGFGSNLSDPARELTLARYCSRMGLAYRDAGFPVSLETFTAYCMDFQRQLVPNVETASVEHLERTGDRFLLRLATGEVFRARKVVLATGLEHAHYLPPEIQNLPRELLSHVSDHHNLNGFRGKDVIVVGGGQSALETAALLSEQGASVRLLARAPMLTWSSPPRTAGRTIFERLRAPSSRLGRGFELWMCSNAPGVFRRLPLPVRLDRVKNVLGPAGSWWLKDRVIDRLTALPGHEVTSAEVHGDRAVLHVRRADGQAERLTTDHVIAATGYRFVLRRLPFLSEDLKSRVCTEYGSPVLSPHFESTATGLYFTGLASAPAFGPSMRFLDGATWTARRISGHLSISRVPQSLESGLALSHASRS